MSHTDQFAARAVEQSLIAGRYRVERALAEGGMGTVYVVLDEQSGETLALKRMRGAQKRDMLALFEREYRTLAGISHPRIIQVHDYGVDGGVPFYTMELVQGRDLHEAAPVPFAEACRYLRDVATCLALLHTRRLLHRDITPRNVRVTPDGHCKLLDFGALTTFGIPDRTVGTPPCVPPEAVRGAPLDQRADLFSFGALAYYMLTGRHAYRAREIDELPAVWQLRLPPPSKYAPGIPPAADALILGLLDLDPNARPRSVAEVVERLNVLGELPAEDARTQRALADSYLLHAQFVGRTGELEALRGELAALQRGTGSALLVEGPAGAGRSRLLHELVLQARLLGLPSVLVDADMHRRQHGTAIAILQQLLPRSPAAHAQAEMRASVLAQLDGELADLLGQTATMPEAAISGDWGARVQESLHDVFAAACRADRLLLVIDNVDDADDASLALLAALQRLTAELPLMLCCSMVTQRDGQASWSGRLLRERCRKIDVRPLSARETFELARSLFGDARELGRFAEWLYTRTGGLPLHCMELVRRLHAEDVVRYVDGLWLLPLEPPDSAAPAALDELLAQRLLPLSPAAYRLSESIAMQRGTLSRERLIALARAEGPDPFVLLEELVRADVLTESLQGFRFSHSALVTALRSRMPAERVRELHLRCAEQELATADPSQQLLARITAGWHFLQAGEESRGAELLADVAYDWRGGGLRSAFADLQVAAPAIEAALRIFTKQGRSQYERMPLLAALACAGFYENRVWAERYGEEALNAVLEVAGVTLATRLQRYLGKTLALCVAMPFAWLRFTLGQRRRRYSFKDVLVQLFSVAVTLTGAAAAALDRAGAERPGRALAPFLHLPARLTFAGIAQYCDALKEIAHENQAYALRIWTSLTERFESPAYFVALPASARLLHKGGLWFARGAFEAFRDGRGALRAAERLDDTGVKLYRMIASQVRGLYHANRGELKQARRHWEQVELHTLQMGSASQVELWEPAALILVYMQLGDVVELRRVAERLATLAKSYAWLALYAELAQLALEQCRHWTGSPLCLAPDDAVVGERLEIAINRGQALFAAAEPRSFIGWGALAGYMARTFNMLGRYEQARAACQSALVHLGPDDRPFVALFLNVEIELAVAEAGLGDQRAARKRLDELFAFHAESDNPLTRGRLHEGYARVTALAGDWPAFRDHIDEMRSWYRGTDAPALLTRCEALAAVEPRPTSKPPRASQPAPPIATTRGGSRTREATGAATVSLVETMDVATVVLPPIQTRTERKG